MKIFSKFFQNFFKNFFKDLLLIKNFVEYKSYIKSYKTYYLNDKIISSKIIYYSI